MRPIHGSTASKANEQLVSNQLKGVITHQFDGALVLGEGIIESDFVSRQPLILASFASGPHILCELDEFLQYLNRAGRVRVVSAYWRAFRDLGLRERKGGDLPRSWLRFANRQKGAQFLGSKHASHPINAMLNCAYVVEAGRLARALTAAGFALFSPGLSWSGLRLNRSGWEVHALQMNS